MSPSYLNKWIWLPLQIRKIYISGNMNGEGDCRLLALSFLVWLQESITSNKMNKSKCPASFKVKGSRELWQGLLHNSVNISSCIRGVMHVSKPSQGTKSVLRNETANAAIHRSVISVLRPQLILQKSFHCPKTLTGISLWSESCGKETYMESHFNCTPASYPLRENLIRSGTGDLQCEGEGQQALQMERAHRSFSQSRVSSSKLMKGPTEAGDGELVLCSCP